MEATKLKESSQNSEHEDPHYEYTADMLIMNLLLLEDHFKHYPCWEECIPKHVYLINGYLSEMMTIAPQEENGFWKDIFEKFNKLIEECAKQKDPIECAMELRRLRLLVMEKRGYAHQRELELKEGCGCQGIIKPFEWDKGLEDLAEKDRKMCELVKEEKVKPKEYFDPRSFRTLCPKCPQQRCALCDPNKPEEFCSTRIIIGCPKGYYDEKTGRCKVSTETHVIYHLKPKAEAAEVCVTKDEWKWEQKKPRTIAERRELLEKFGARCFLDPENLKFPICNKQGCVDCDGLRAAYVRAKALITAAKRAGRDDLAKYYWEIADKAIELAKEYGCDWVKVAEGKSLEELHDFLLTLRNQHLSGGSGVKDIWSRNS